MIAWTSTSSVGGSVLIYEYYSTEPTTSATDWQSGREDDSYVIYEQGEMWTHGEAITTEEKEPEEPRPLSPPAHQPEAERRVGSGKLDRFRSNVWPIIARARSPPFCSSITA